MFDWTHGSLAVRLLHEFRRASYGSAMPAIQPHIKRMNRHTILTSLTVLFGGLVAPAIAQPQDVDGPHTIRGYVQEAVSAERIPGVAVFVPSLDIGVTTNQFGYYSLTADLDSIQLVVSHVGYDLRRLVFRLEGDTTLIVRLTPRVVGMEAVEVTAEAVMSADEVQMGRHDIPIEQIETLPVLLGEIDIQKTLQLLPGVQSGMEGASGLYVRGGRADQNLILLDGLPLYNPSHLFGFLSVFYGAAMKHVELIKGGFPARYGGRLSSVVNYTMKEGNLQRFSGESAVGLLAARVMVEGPIMRDRASFLVAARRTYVDRLVRRFQEPEKELLGGYFYDLNVKANYIVSDRDRVYLSVYAGQDGFKHEQNEIVPLRTGGDEPPPDRTGAGRSPRHATDVGWRNRLAAVRWNRLLGDRTFANVLLGVTGYRYAVDRRYESGSEDDPTIFDHSWQSGIMDITSKIDVEYLPSPRHQLRFGGEAVFHRFRPGRTSSRETRSGVTPRRTVASPTGNLASVETSLYVEDEIVLRPTMRANVGLRFTSYFAKGQSYLMLEPRIGVNYKLARGTAAKLSWAVMSQNVHLLTGGAATIPTDLWIPSTDGIAPQRGHQLAVGLAQSFRELGIEISAEAYYKWMRRLREYADDANAFGAANLNWVNVTEYGNGASYGFEAFVQKKKGRLTGWVGYTWSRSTRTFKNLNDGRTFPDSYDRRHDLSAVTQFEVADWLSVSVAWVYGSGYPVWLPVGRFLGDESGTLWRYPIDLVDFADRNSTRMPSYHRLDWAAHFRVWRSWLSIGMYNTYNRKNSLFIYPKIVQFRNEAKQDPVEFRSISLLPLVPSLTWQVRF